MVVKTIYKVFRSIIFTLTLLVVGIYVLSYTLLSIPAVTNKIKDIACRELSSLLGGSVEIAELDIYPFNEVKLTGVGIFSPTGEQCVEIEILGAGINLWKLITENRIILTYGEIIGLKGNIVQAEKGGKLNIQFIIDALSSKDDNKEKKPFELALRNVVLRKSNISFKRPWLENAKIGSLDLANLEVAELAADISFPKISDKETEMDLRRLSMSIPGAIKIKELSLTGKFSNTGLELQNFTLEMPNSYLFIPEIFLYPEEGENFADAIKHGEHHLFITKSYITPSDFSFLLPALADLSQPLDIRLDAKGNYNSVKVDDFNFGKEGYLNLTFTGGADNLSDISNLRADISNLKLFIGETPLAYVEKLFNNLPAPVSNIIHEAGYIDFSGEFSGAMTNKSLAGNFALLTRNFKISAEGNVSQNSKSAWSGAAETFIENFDINNIFPSVPVNTFSGNIIAEGSYANGNPQGLLSMVIDRFELKGKEYEGFSINLNKTGDLIDGDILMHNEIADVEANFDANIEGEAKSLRLDMELQRLNLSEVIDMKGYNGYIIAGDINVDGEFSGENDLRGNLALNNLSLTSADRERELLLHQLNIEAGKTDSINTIFLTSDWVDARLEGDYHLGSLPRQLRRLGESVFPIMFNPSESTAAYNPSDLDFDIHIKKDNTLPEFFNLPIRLLVPVNIAGTIEGSSNSANFTLDLPYLQQGRDKLIYDTRLIAEIDGDEGILNSLIETNVPVKRGDLALNVSLYARENILSTDLHFINTENSDFKGELILDTEIKRNEFDSKQFIDVEIKPTVLHLGPTDWNVAQSQIRYADNKIDVSGLRIWHDNQFVEISGTASAEYQDAIEVVLADIDVNYIFDMLQINYVTFGGIATGEVVGHSLLSGNPVAETESLLIKEFSYNGAILGECVASSRWNNDQKEIEIAADISNNGRQIVKANGGIWLGVDSLSFDMSAFKVPVEFVQPFMKVFSSHVGGIATGDIKLFGNFRDIDMTGKIFADSVAVKLDYTNTVYHGSDSIFLNPGKIEIPHFRLYDKFGNSAMLTGELTHKYFHEPAFTFRLSEAENFLCYDTSSDLNPDWYGTLFGNGSAQVKGVPGLVDISADMSVGGNSKFTFVLNDTEYARDYQFLTFSDKSKVEDKPKEITPQDIKAMLKQNMTQQQDGLSLFGIDIRATVTPEVLFTLVMDPAAGDKITARGKGALQVKYESDDDEMTMYGKYEIEEGNYNFSLQDIILRDFKIKEGSSISFNGNPLAAHLDISATYRVNTNLTDLDKSFSTDRDLNRTNVPVDAVLSVVGNMTEPDITFDIELPTLTQDVERKVKSIISTDDMMNRQIIYLLALNRFYTPEYMGSQSNGGELAAVASSTISSQLSNIMGQLSDKFSVAPSFRSDKGDFSDIEVDVALSSRLLNNRLLINGNLGYRDKSTSSTTFIGDFDIEYLLTKNGNLRLKAYNHFNDQNYYLREALTTQGLGLVFRKDFNDMFKFLKKKPKPEDEKEEERDSEKQVIEDGTKD